MNTSYDQKIDKKDGAPKANSGDGINTLSDILDRLDITNNDELLFQDPPTRKECPICMLPMPHSSGVCGVEVSYMTCCGMIVCSGCTFAEIQEMEKGTIKKCCAFCRMPIYRTDKEFVKRIKKRMKLNDADAFFSMGCLYYHGQRGLSQDRNKGLVLWNQAAELGLVNAHYNLSTAYFSGDGIEKDMTKATYHYKMAAIGGHEEARHNLGCMDERSGNHLQAMKHYMIAARAGYDSSLKIVGQGYKHGLVTKDEYASTLRAFQVSIDEMKSEQRTEASFATTKRIDAAAARR